MRNNKDIKLANMVVNSTMVVFRQRLYANSSYPGYFSAKMQVEGIKNAYLIGRPVSEVAEIMYSAVVSNIPYP